MRKFLVTVNGNSYEVVVEEIDGVARIQPPPAATSISAPAPVAPLTPAKAPAEKAPAATAAASAPAGSEKILSPMPGNILSVSVEVGQSVKVGDVLLLLEAMKMENEIPCTVNGKVLQIAVAKGSVVNTGDLLVVIGS